MSLSVSRRRLLKSAAAFIGAVPLIGPIPRAHAETTLERAKAQGANDQAIFIMMVISSFTSGMTVTTAGWERVNLMALPLIALVTAAILWFRFKR